MKTIKSNIAVLKFVYRFCPMMILFAIFYIIASVALSVSKIYLIYRAIDLVMSGAAIDLLFTSLIQFIIIIVVASFFKIFYTYYINVRYRVIFIKKMQQFMFKKVKHIDMESFDNPQFYDNYSRALREGIFRGIRVFEELVKFITSISITIAIGTIIIISDPILILIILASSLVNVIVVNAINKKWYLWSKETEPDRRMYYYINRTFYRQKFAGEIKTTPISDLLIEKYQETAGIINKKYATTHKTVLWLRTIYNASRAFIEQGASYAYLGYKLFSGIIAISVFTATLNATLQFSSNFIDAVNFLTTLRENAFYIDDFMWLVNYKPKLEDQEGLSLDHFDTVDIQNVSFQYPDTEQFCLADMAFHINKGDKIAIVGPNGGGKTTLTKLLLHFYTPTKGHIEANGIHYSDIAGKSIRDKYAIVFQDFQIYALTIGENVLMRKVQNQSDEDRIWNALEKVGMKDKIMALPEGIKTQVTREFNRDGAVFSGGEVQRIAIARVFASDADIYILDEPTSSLDPLSEEKINKLIIQNTEKAMIIIAHRLSTVVDADKIYLVDKGRIVESGTHEEMIHINGLYAKMFNTQKSLYQKEA